VVHELSFGELTFLLAVLKNNYIEIVISFFIYRINNQKVIIMKMFDE